MVEQSTQTNITERVKKKLGRPKGTGIFTEEENKERARQRNMSYYPLNSKKERERKRLEHHSKIMFKLIPFYFFIFINFHLNS